MHFGVNVFDNVSKKDVRFRHSSICLNWRLTAVSLYRYRLTSIRIPIIKITWSCIYSGNPSTWKDGLYLTWRLGCHSPDSSPYYRDLATYRSHRSWPQGCCPPDSSVWLGLCEQSVGLWGTPPRGLSAGQCSPVRESWVALHPPSCPEIGRRDHGTCRQTDGSQTRQCREVKRCHLSLWIISSSQQNFTKTNWTDSILKNNMLSKKHSEGANLRFP